MELKLCFAEPEQRPLTALEINELSIAAQGALAIVKVMDIYVNEKQDNESAAHCLEAFRVLQWLLEPIGDYLFNFAGDKEIPEPGEPAGGE
jgi:hypothetical protein